MFNFSLSMNRVLVWITELAFFITHFIDKILKSNCIDNYSLIHATDLIPSIRMFRFILTIAYFCLTSSDSSEDWFNRLHRSANNHLFIHLDDLFGITYDQTKMVSNCKFNWDLKYWDFNTINFYL